ncbi:hypothetical protein Q4I28_007313 [Leishmania naiffi]|uniref:Uncharacterized protein n=1 Tax=Leishmania naiffi TaxID=5678 RepID=A0AAW3B8A5_9TRYP
MKPVATVEASKKANKSNSRARLGYGSGPAGGGLGSGTGATVTDGSATHAPDTIAELQEEVITQRHVIEQMVQRMRNTGHVLLAVRRQLPPLLLTLPHPSSSGAASTTSSPRQATAEGDGASMVATQDAVTTTERLTVPYANSGDVATGSAQCLHLEEVHGATSEETARNATLLEERLQQVQKTQGVMYNRDSNRSFTNASAFEKELHTLLVEGGNGGGVAVAEAVHYGEEGRQQNRANSAEGHGGGRQ